VKQARLRRWETILSLFLEELQWTLSRQRTSNSWTSSFPFLSPDYCQVRAHRAIALLDSMGKLVEKTAAHLIADQLERSQSLHEGQYGCRRRRSCVDTVAVLISDAERAWSRKRIAGALLMDVKSAFNNVSRGHLIGRLMELGVEGDLVS